MWLRGKMVQLLGGGAVEQMSLNTWARLQMMALGALKKPADVALLRKVRKERKSLLGAFEMATVLLLARGQLKLTGDYAEVGAYQGASAKLICEAKGDRRFRVFDTFEGLPKMSDKDAGVHSEHQYACSLESVQEYLRGYPNVSFHKGIFPESTQGVEEARYAFVHFDVDLYEGTKACLEYFYPRMVPGGVMLSHDYCMLKGVETAFREFMADKPETIIEQPTTQCMVVKS